MNSKILNDCFQVNNYRAWSEAELEQGLEQDKLELTFFFKMFNLKFGRNPIILKYLHQESWNFKLNYYLNWISLKRHLPQLKTNQSQMMSYLRVTHHLIQNQTITLDTLFIENTNSDHQKWVILCHGLNSNKYKSFFYGWYYFCQGYHLVIYDSRNHGDSTKSAISFGAAEKNDLAVIIGKLRREKNPTEINFHGWSMGSMVISCYLKAFGSSLPSRFAILDSPIDSLNHLWSTVMERWNISYYEKFALWNHYCLNKYQYSPLQVVPGIDYQQMTNHNAYFIVYDHDNLTPPALGQIAYANKKKGYNLLSNYPYKHAQGIYQTYDEYFNNIQKFIDKCPVTNRE